MADIPMKVVKLDDTTVFVAKLDAPIAPGEEYEVELTIKKAGGGPGAAGCTAMGSCGTFSLLNEALK